MLTADMTIRRRTVRLQIAIATMIVYLGVGAGRAAAGPILHVTGDTAGCFGSACGSFATPVSSSATYGLTFTGAVVDVTTDALGAATNIDLGTLSRDNVNVTDSLPALPFTLNLTFSLPTGIVGGQFDLLNASITGASPGGGAPLNVNFDNGWQLFAFSNASGSGSFELAVLNDPSVSKNGSTAILGSIRNASVTSVETPTPTVPEPVTLALFGIGALAWSRRARRR
jgi:hypothetical protein